ncbi:MAG TPA: AraC family transcriptional regulator [Polyangiaceae bacterium]|nr:AraC family transcriptional regulator [Polyangiaceae bacterium]
MPTLDVRSVSSQPLPPAPVSPIKAKDSLGCAMSELAVDHVLSGSGMVFRRKAAAGVHKSHVTTPAQDRGLLIGVSLVDGHKRSGGKRGDRRERMFDTGDIYIRDFESDYEADMDGAFDFFLVELTSDFFGSATRLVDRPPSDLARVQASADQVLRHLALALLPALAQPDVASSLFVEQISVAIGAHLLHHHRPDGSTRSSGTHRLGAPAMRRAQEMLVERLDQQPSLERIADALDMSRSAFFESFRTTVGVTPYQWLLSQRVERARRLLLETNLPLMEVALSCGFSDQSHFTRIFRRIEGLSPGRWRRSAQ